MNNTTSPHVLFRKILELLDELRRESITAISTSPQRKEHNLTARQGAAISQLHLMIEEEPDGVSLKALSKRLQMTVPATSLLVESMVSKGYMTRSPNPKDRRAVCITLTDKGKKVFDSVYAQFHEEIDRRASKLSREELRIFARVVEIMTK